MARCYETCKYNVCGFCRKYHEFIHTSKVVGHCGMLIHPLEYLETYYRSDSDIAHLIEVAEEFLSDEVAKNICQQFKTKGYISYKQRRYLVYNLLHCAEDSGKWVIKSV